MSRAELAGSLELLRDGEAADSDRLAVEIETGWRLQALATMADVLGLEEE